MKDIFQSSLTTQHKYDIYMWKTENMVKTLKFNIHLSFSLLEKKFKESQKYLWIVKPTGFTLDKNRSYPYPNS